MAQLGLNNFEYQDGNGFCTTVKTCRCETCKNYFWVPSDGKFGSLSELAPEHVPTFCCFCGIRIDPDEISYMDASDDHEMRDVLPDGEIDQ